MGKSRLSFIDIALLYSGFQQLCLGGQVYWWRKPEYPTKRKYLISEITFIR
jgi:hypothetical protein